MCPCCREKRLMYTQRRYDNKSSYRNAPWRIDWDLPEELQFCSYIGQVHDFRPDATVGNNVQPLKRQWIEWWKQLHSAFASRPDLLSMTTPASASPLAALRYEPPLFPELEDRLHLQTVCREHWLYFNQLWNGPGGGRRQLNQQLAELLRQLDLNELVQKCVQLTGRSGGVAFLLRIGVVRWPEDFRRLVSKDCLVIGSDYLEPRQREAILSLLQSRICELIEDKR
jgi:hypothetical protein